MPVGLAVAPEGLAGGAAETADTSPKISKTAQMPRLAMRDMVPSLEPTRCLKFRPGSPGEPGRTVPPNLARLYDKIDANRKMSCRQSQKTGKLVKTGSFRAARLSVQPGELSMKNRRETNLHPIQIPEEAPMSATAHWGLPYWLDFERPQFPTLEGDLSTEVAIIGGGIAGLKLAHSLSQRGIPVVILEGGRVGDGASGRNQGSLNHGPGFGYAECIARHSRTVAQELWRLGLDNHQLMRAQLAEYEVDCDYQVEGFWFLARADMPDHEATLRTYRTDLELLADDGFEVEWLDQSAARERGGNPLYTGGFGYLTDAQFHSGKYIAGLARGIARRPGVRLFEQARIVQIEPCGSGALARTQNGHVVRARHVFLAVNALAPQFVRSLETSLRAERGQVLVTAPLDTRPCQGSFGTALAWWREIIEPDGRWRLLFGGGRTRETPDSLFPQFEADGSPSKRLEQEGFLPSAEHQARLETQFAILFPHLRKVPITHRWGGLQSFTADCLPVIGEFDPSRQIHGLAGFSGRGNCFADVGAEYLASRLCEERGMIETRYHSLFKTLLNVSRPTAQWGPWKFSPG